MLFGAVVVLGSAWLGPLPRLAPHHFSAHMTLHIAVVAVAAPLLALGLAGSRADPVRAHPAWWSAVPLSILELVVVWSWHAPALHRLARETKLGLVAEQSMFLIAAFLVWMAALGGDRAHDDHRDVAGIAALLLTSIHMTLLGALIALAPRPLYDHAHPPLAGGRQLGEQELGGILMLLVGGVAYLVGGLGLAARLLRRSPSAREREPLEQAETR
jgi:putative membrane protein